MEVSAVTILMFTMDKSGFQKFEKNKIIISFQNEIALLFFKFPQHSIIKLRYVNNRVRTEMERSSFKTAQLT